MRFQLYPKLLWVNYSTPLSYACEDFAFYFELCRVNCSFVLSNACEIPPFTLLKFLGSNVQLLLQMHVKFSLYLKLLRTNYTIIFLNICDIFPLTLTFLRSIVFSNAPNQTHTTL
jgi:hypothetical protein